MQKDSEIQQMVRVNLAGEYGAIRIYQGQIAAMKKRGGADPEYMQELKHMCAQEKEHLKFFQKKLVEIGGRPTVFHPVWHVFGYALGYISAKMGETSAMACTVAVEEVIDEHYSQQLAIMDKVAEPELHRAIDTFRKEELEHKDIALEHKAEEAPFYHLLHFSVQAASKAAIWLSKRF